MKNIKSFCGKPLIWWNLNQLQQTINVDKIIVATDCNQIANVVDSFEMSKVDIYKRTQENAQDHSSTESVLIEYIKHAELDDNDTLMLVQCTSVFTTKDHFVKAIDYYNSGSNDSLLSATESKQFFWSSDGKAINYNYKDRPRRQDFNGQYLENGALYINKVASILKSNNRISGTIGIYAMPGHTSIELDENIDWEIAESVMEKIIGKEYPQV